MLWQAGKTNCMHGVQVRAVCRRAKCCFRNVASRELFRVSALNFYNFSGASAFVSQNFAIFPENTPPETLIPQAPAGRSEKKVKKNEKIFKKS